MKVVIFGATGMIGQGVLRECLLDNGIDEVVTVGRAPVGQTHPKLRDLTVPNVADLSPIADQLKDVDACFFCLGVSAAGMNEEQYLAITFDLTLAVAKALAHPDLTFIYVSGAGTGSSRMMWAKVKRATENALLAMPIESYMMRPGIIQPLHGITSRTTWYRVIYRITRPIFPLLKRVFPRAMLSTEQMGKAMIAVARNGDSRRVLEVADINRLAG